MIQKLRKTRGIYKLIDHGEIVYIGSSEFCEKRIHDHAKLKYFTHYEIESREESGENLLNVEAEMIAKYIPKLNANIPIQKDFSTLDRFSKLINDRNSF